MTTSTRADGQESPPVQSAQQSPTSEIRAQTLEDLIPQSVIEDAEDWAAQGTSGEPRQDRSALDAIETEPDASLIQGDAFDIDAALDDLEITVAEPLPVDTERPSFAEIDVPTLVDLPDLAEIAISDQLILAFPAEAGRFPEEAEFIARFRALSAIEALGTGEDTIPQLAARARSDEALLNNVLRNYGYYNGEVIRQLSGGRRGFADQTEQSSEAAVDSEPQVRFDVLPGPQYVFGALDLGELSALAEAERMPLLDAFGLQRGDPLYADAIVAGEAQLRLALGERGYPFSNLGTPELLIDHARETGDLTLPVDPGGKFAFGEVISDDPEFLSGRHLGRIARFDPGDLYQTSMQSDLRRAILATGLVSSVTITPRAVTPPNGEEPGQVALDVAIERAPLRTISGALGYGTEDGLKVEAAWEHRNLFPPEGALRLRGILGTREQLASVTFRRSNFRGRDQILTFDTFVSDIETEAVDARTIAFRSTFERVSNLLFQKPFSWQLGAEVLYSDERNRVTNGIVRPRQEYLIGGVFGRVTLDGSDDLLDPRSGYRLSFFAEPELSRTLGEVSPYLRARIDASFYQPVGGTVIAARAAVATVVGADLLDIAPSRRLYSGGGGSVRGYGFQAIGPRNSFDEPQGGRSLVEGAIEARIPTGVLDGALEVVPFFDLGSISSNAQPDFDEVRFGAGIGVRYKTSFGPIRVDVGVPLNPTAFDAPVVVYVSLGQAF
ncbi:MAG: BamA/TamA family outer membrane protein [Pseudomonadota bacterium]